MSKKPLVSARFFQKYHKNLEENPNKILLGGRKTDENWQQFTH